MDDYLQQNQLLLISHLLTAENKILILPTETIYGLSCSIYNIKGSSLIKKMKKRSPDQELTVLVRSFSELKDIMEVTPKIKKIVKQMLRLKKPLTVIGEKNKFSPYQVYVSRNNLVGVRITRDRWLKKLLAKTGPIFSTSVNQHNEPPINQLERLATFLPKNQIVENKKIHMTLKPSNIYNSIEGNFVR